MRIVGSRKIKPIMLEASYDCFVEGCNFNDQIHKLPGGSQTCIIKGIYRFKNHEQSNLHWEKSLADKMANQALQND